MNGNIRGTFECLGVHLGESTTENVRGDCPFCGKEDHFFLNTKTGQWDCKVCGEEGNVITFLGRMAEQNHKETHRRDWDLLAKQRSTTKTAVLNPPVPISVFKRWRMGWTGTEWWIPCYSEKGTVRDIRRWNGQKVMSTTGRPLQLLGMKELAAAPRGTMVWVCEGEWDTMMLRWLLDEAGRSQDVVVGVPGAKVFKPEWAQFFKGMRVRVCFDNDDAGDKGGMKVGGLVQGLALSVEYLCWPERRPSGYDIRDFVIDSCAEMVNAQEAAEVLDGLMRRTHRRAETPSVEESRADEAVQSDEIASFKEVVEVFRSWVKLDQEFIDGIAVCLAVCLANDVPGDPLWMYFVGPPGSGKTLVLMATQTSDRTKFYSTLTPASLVSGFNVHPDPSLLPELNGKAAIFKDGTELTSMHPDARREIYGVLRGAFDGHVLKRFGNGVLREYRLHFNMVIGVTPVIHGDNQATMGERFIKYEMRDNDTDDKVKRAVRNLAEEIQMQEELSDVCRRFLLRQVDPAQLPEMDDEIVDRIVALAQLVAMLRATVDREAYGDRDVKYRAAHEVGTRIAKQMAKLGQMLTFVYEVPKINGKIMKVLQKVAFDTMIGFHLDIVRAVIDSAVGLTRNQIAKKAKIPDMTASRRIQDLEHLGVLEKVNQREVTDRPGSSPALWRVTKRTADLWARAIGAARPPEPAGRA